MKEARSLIEGTRRTSDAGKSVRGMPYVKGDEKSDRLSITTRGQIASRGWVKPATTSAVSDVTQILAAIEQGDPQAADKLLPLVYEELRRLAAHKMANEAAGQTLQPTALVHEAWLRLVGKENPKFQDRRYFFAAAAEAMRRILIENARRKRALRHGGGQQRVDLEKVDLPFANDDDDHLLAVNDALDKLAAHSKSEAELVKLRFFVGMTLEEAAEALGISARTADSYWAHARAWLFDELTARGS